MAGHCTHSNLMVRWHSTPHVCLHTTRRLSLGAPRRSRCRAQYRDSGWGDTSNGNYNSPENSANDIDPRNYSNYATSTSYSEYDGHSRSFQQGATAAGNGTKNGYTDGWSNSGQTSKSMEDTGWGTTQPLDDWGSATSPPDGYYNPSDFPPPPAFQADFAATSREGEYSSQQAQFSAALDYLPSDITLLTARERESLISAVPTGRQAQFYQPRTLPERTVQVAGSLLGVVMFSKTAALAVPALLYPVWGPWVWAGVRNLELLSKNYSCMGLWRSQVLDIELTSGVPTSPDFRVDPLQTVVRMVVGDPWPGGARSELIFPYVMGCEDVLVGEPAELVVLSNEPSFEAFKVVREVYLPQSGIWLSEYPFIQREAFLGVSLDIERSRQRPMEEYSNVPAADIHMGYNMAEPSYTPGFTNYDDGFRNTNYDAGYTGVDQQYNGMDQQYNGMNQQYNGMNQQYSSAAGYEGGGRFGTRGEDRLPMGQGSRTDRGGSERVMNAGRFSSGDGEGRGGDPSKVESSDFAGNDSRRIDSESGWISSIGRS